MNGPDVDSEAIKIVESEFHLGLVVALQAPSKEAENAERMDVRLLAARSGWGVLRLFWRMTRLIVAFQVLRFAEMVLPKGDRGRHAILLAELGVCYRGMAYGQAAREAAHRMARGA